MNPNIIDAIIAYNLVNTILTFVMFIIIILVIINIFSPRRSQTYRKLLTDMYVAGKIKKLASNEDINLANEEKNFNLWCKKKRLEYLDLDKAIEEEMKEKIAEEEENKKE